MQYPLLLLHAGETCSSARAKRSSRFEEIERFVGASGRVLGVDKMRITGGEPLVRKDLPRLDRADFAMQGIRDLALTTNGVLLAEQASALYDAGLRRINIHLDTLDRERFETITRRDEFDRVMAGIEACLALGYQASRSMPSR